MAEHLPESRVVKLWQDCPGRSDLCTPESGPLKVLYPGRINDNCGADFRDAVIATSCGLQTGDIEIHTKSSLWRAHRHHLDPLYNRVVLHVVFQRDTANPVRLQNGREVPTLALQELAAPDTSASQSIAPPVPCQGAGQLYGDGFLSEILDAAGDARFLSRASGFLSSASDAEAGQALYAGIMTALGYSRNQFAMAELACRMPLRRLEATARSTENEHEYTAVCEAVLLGAAGMASPACADTVSMSMKDWRFFRLRPGNHPALRIAAMAGLLSRNRETGLLNGLIEMFKNAPAEKGLRFLENALIIEGREGKTSGNIYKAALLGRQRASDIIINVWLPFVSAWGRANNRPEMAEKALDLYRRCAAASGNTLERHMCRQFGIAPGTIKTARRQQGLLHILKSFCAVGKCRECPVFKTLNLTGKR